MLRTLWKKRVWRKKDDAKSKKIEVGVSLMHDVTNYLDNYKAYRLEDLDGAAYMFIERWVI